MSSLWTPDGEYPVGPKSDTPSQASGGARQNPGEVPVGPDGEPELTQEQLREAEAYMQALAQTPARVVVVNHVVSIFQLAQIHLASDPPRFDDARLAIDAAAAIVDHLGDRLGPEAKELGDATAQLRMAFVQIQAAFGKEGNGDAPTGADGAAGAQPEHPGEPRH